LRLIFRVVEAQRNDRLYISALACGCDLSWGFGDKGESMHTTSLKLILEQVIYQSMPLQ
jgi:hypothetical protein